MEKYNDLIKSLLLTIGSSSVLIYMWRKNMFKNSGKNIYFKSLDYRVIMILATGILCGIILTIKACKKLF